MSISGFLSFTRAPGPARSIFRWVKLLPILFVSVVCACAAQTPTPAPLPAIVTPLTTAELENFQSNPPAVQRLFETALALTRENLTYLYGSSDPANGGMDCSGTIFHVLRAVGIDDVPRTRERAIRLGA